MSDDLGINSSSVSLRFRNRLLLVSLVLALPLPLTRPVSAQKAKNRQNNRENVRKLERPKNTAIEVRQSFEQRTADGLNVTIYQFTTNGIVAVDPRTAFKSGDRFRLRLHSNFDGFVYVVNVTPGGANTLLFPRAQSRVNNVRAGQFYYIPAENEFKFNDEAGLEVLQIVMSRSRIAFLDAALDRAPKKATHIPLDAATVKALEQLAGNPARLKTAGISTAAAPQSKAGIRTRMLILDRKKESTFVIVSGNKGIPSRFQPGEVSVFEIRLNHH